jgi:uncharacterized protein (TIGR02145 family)
MKKLHIVLAFVFLSTTLIAQVPQKFSYQAIIRNAANQQVVNQKISIRISILQATATGLPVYVETQTPTTNAIGLANMEIGAGTVVSGQFQSIDWGTGPYFVKSETDVLGGTNYSISGTSQLLSVPYAMAAGSVASTKNGKAYDSYLKDDGTYVGLVNIVVQQPDVTTPTVTDIEGNVYGTVKIGTQVWMTENLKVTKLNDGTIIPVVTDPKLWAPLRTPALCNYNNTTNVDSINTFGRLYNWYAVNSAKLAPAGWHVPTDAEWTILSDYLGDFGGMRMKETGTTHWLAPNADATNDSKFKALPSGARYYDGIYYGNGNYAAWWSATSFYTNTSLSRYIHASNSTLFYTGHTKWAALSVRCIKD